MLELRDVSDELETDTGEDVSGSRALSPDRKDQLNELSRSARVREAAEQHAATMARMGGVGWEEIAKNLAVDASIARNLSATSRNPLSYTAMKIAKRVYDLAEEFPAGTVPTNASGIVSIGKEAIYSTLIVKNYGWAIAEDILT